MVYVQLKHIHIVPHWVRSLEKNRIPALMGNVVNNHFLINTREIIFYKWMHLLECRYRASVHLADYLWALLSPDAPFYKPSCQIDQIKIYSGAEIKD